MVECTSEAASGVFMGVERCGTRLWRWHCLSGGDEARLGVCSLENLGVGRLFPTHAGVGKAAHMSVVDTTVNWEGICFSIFVGHDLLD